MIIQKQKTLDEIVESLAGEKKIFLAGCADCATTCKVGGEEELVDMKAKLEEKGFTVTGTHVFDTACLQGEVRKKYQEHKQAIDEADSILVMACGTGVQTLGDQLGKRVHAGADALFIGEVVRMGKYLEKCSACGECILEYTDGICPVTRCAKGLLNGPCGGYNKDGKCEIDPDRECAWLQIYDRLKERGHLNKIKKYHEPKKFSAKPKSGQYKFPRPEKKSEKEAG